MYRRLLQAGICLFVGATAAGVAAPAAAFAAGSGSYVYVDGASKAGTCSDARTRSGAGSPQNPVCTLTRALALALPGDTVVAAKATYSGPVRIPSGRAGATLTLRGEPGAVIDAAGAATGVLLSSVSYVRVTGFSIIRATAQGVWAAACANVSLDNDVVVDNSGAGIQVKSCTDFSVTSSTIKHNGSAGIQELGGVVRGLYSDDLITQNGWGAAPFNGDGIQLNGTAATIARDVISYNGSDPLYEHGVYASAGATSYVIDSCTMTGNAATQIKAEGSGTITRNHLGSAPNGMYVDKNTGPGVVFSNNVVDGTFVHALATATGAILNATNNTLVNRADSTSAGQPAAVFIGPGATRITLNRNHFSVTAGIGRTLVITGPTSSLAFLSSDANYFSTPQAATSLAIGLHSMSLTAWQQQGQDRHSTALYVA